MNGHAGFHGFPEETVAFLRDLRSNNERAWFNDNKAVYERAIKRPAQAFCQAMTSVLDQLTGLSHGSKVYRIHRDVRFSRDKTPYNTHLHIAFVPEHGTGTPPCWFFGLDPERLTLGAGLFAFDKDDLDGFRRRVAGADGAALQGVLDELARAGGRVTGDVLKRVPPGYPKDHPRADLLQKKGLAAWIDDAEPAVVSRPDLMDRCRTRYETLKPVFDWLKR